MPLPSLTELSSEFIGIPSVTSDTGACKAAIEFAVALLQDLPNVDIRHYEFNDRSSMVACYKCDKEPDTLLQAHLDVVPGPDSCFRPQINGDLLLGRGAYDMKGAAATLMRAFETHVRAGRSTSVALMLTTDEEVGGMNGVGALLEHEGYRPGCVILPDGGQNFSLVTNQYGIVWANVFHRGVSAHSSRPEEGNNAILSFMPLFTELELALAKLPETLCSLSILRAGEAHNVIPGMCEAGIDIRSSNPARVIEILKETFDAEELEILTDEPAFTCDTSLACVQHYRSIAEKHVGRDVPDILERGASDARYFSERGIPVMLTAPDGGAHHQDGEWVHLSSLHTLEKIVDEFLSTYTPA